MGTYFMMGEYSTEALEKISPERTEQAQKLIEQHNGKVKEIYILLGDYDLIFIAAFPDSQEALKASVALTKLTGIAFSTSEAITAAQFDKMMSK